MMKRNLSVRAVMLVLVLMPVFLAQGDFCYLSFSSRIMLTPSY
jgi:hypothetical protein